MWEQLYLSLNPQKQVHIRKYVNNNIDYVQSTQK